MPAPLRSLFWIAIGAAILLSPAVVWGRPFIFFDTPDYWGWGRDTVAALARPWPHPGQPWIGRALYGWPRGATPDDLRFMLSGISGRSAFYAVPLFLLTSLAGFWLVAVVQALAVAAALWAAVRAAAPTAGALAYVVIVALLTAVSSVGFETALAMPDVFGGVALLAAALLVAMPRRLGPLARIGLCALIVYATLAHSANVLIVAAGLVLGLLVCLRLGLAAAAARVAPLAAALGVSLVLAALGGAALSSAYGRPIPTAPFIAGRVLADGGAQRYLQQVCPAAKLASCDLATVQTGPEYYIAIYPLAPPPTGDPRFLYDQLQYHVITDAEVAQRERFVAEQPRLVIGAFLADGPHQAGLMLARGVATFVNFRIGPELDSLPGLMQEKTQRHDQIVALMAGTTPCVRAGGTCPALDVGLLGPLQVIAVGVSLGFIALRLLGRAGKVDEDLNLFMILSIGLVLANALICGALSGPYARYQVRVEWLIPLTALLQALAMAPQARARAATLPSSVAPIVPTHPAKARP